MNTAKSGRTAPAPAAALPPIAIIVSRYNATITDRLLEGARAEYTRRGGDASTLEVVYAPGAYELPTLANAAARSGRFAGVCTLGCIIRGETSHDVYIAQAVAEGLVNLTLLTGVPVAFGVLTVNNNAQAKARAGGKLGNKGEEAMGALLETVAAVDAIEGASVASAARSLARPDKLRAAPKPSRRGKVAS